MELPSSDMPQPDSASQGPIVATTLVSILAVALAGAFAPALVVFGLVFNPFPLGIIPNTVRLSDEENKALQQTASERIWVAIVLSILVLALVVTLAIILGRLALRRRALRSSDNTSAQLAQWAMGLLAGSIFAGVLGVCPVTGALGGLFASGLFGLLTLIVLVLTPGGVMASLILSSLAVGNTRDRRWRIAAVSDFTLTLLLWLAWAAFMAWFALQIATTFHHPQPIHGL